MDKNSKSNSELEPPGNERQLLDKKAEEYLREGGTIEDMPNPKEEEDEQKLIRLLKEQQEQEKIDRTQSNSERKDNK